MQENGKVYLIGAGPGRAELMTLKGHRLLKKADAVVYDELIDHHLLNEVKPACRMIYAGKKSKSNSSSQNNINKLLVKLAREGNLVARIKGGDPFMFGRGAEEGLYLKENQIPFEVVPGVTSAGGCAAYAGIPLTDRNLSSSVIFLTGHHAKTLPGNIRWKSLLDAADTLVIFMAVANLSQIQKQILSKGCDPKTPAAIIEWGSWGRQRSFYGDVKSLVSLSKKNRLNPPAIIVIGKVVALSEKLNWYERLPLFGKRVVITRSRSQISSFRGRLEDLGAEVIELGPVNETIHKVNECVKADDLETLSRIYERILEKLLGKG